MKSNIKYRHEFKYLCTTAQIEILKSRLKYILPIDKHASDDGYCVRSMYFDNYENKCFYENENGTDLREKYRIRIYNADPSRISLECKKKERGKTQKSSCLLTVDQYNMLLRGGNLNNIEGNDKLLNKFLYIMKTQYMKPAVIVEYDRIPFVCSAGNVRITLDTNIRSSNSFNSFFSADISSRLILPSGQHLLEVKFDEFLPAYIKEILQLDNLQQTTFSKYYLCRKYSLGVNNL